MKNRVLLFFLLFMAGSIFVSCSSKEQKKIGLLIHSTENVRWQSDIQNLQKRAKEKNVQILIKDAENDENLQLRQAFELIEEGVQVMIVIPANQNTAAGIVRAAAENRIPVISYDRLIRNADLACLLSFDYVSVGKQMAETVLQKMPKGNVVLLWGDADDANARFIQQGFEETISPYKKDGSVNILYSQYIEDYSLTMTQNVMQKVVEFSNQPIDAVICGSAAIAETVADFFNKIEYDRNVLIAGQDLTAETRDLIMSGELYMTVYKSLEDLAFSAIDLACEMKRNGTFKKRKIDRYVNNGRSDIPAILLSPSSVTKQNLMDFVSEAEVITDNDLVSN